eukprot:Nitzschia sp. Nitz4//scaffold102_size76354//4090//4781//NITZ4_005621-RA/size76354-exonerate_est2genome-gene-0.0-mRNA-1//1//CDS//3329532216//4785//frame0
MSFGVSVAEKESLWCAALEMFVHQVLFVRRVYPLDCFCTTRFLGVQCHANRHPDVVKYISTTIELVVSALMAGDSDEMALVIVDQATGLEHEQYFLHLQYRTDKTNMSISNIEREFRDLILRVLSLRGLEAPNWRSSTTFQIKLYVPNQIEKCFTLKEALGNGAWYSSGGVHSREVESKHPLHQMEILGCRLYRIYPNKEYCYK